MNIPTLHDISVQLTPSHTIAAGEVLPYTYAQKIWALIVNAQADGFDQGYKIAMRTVICRMKELGAWEGGEYCAPIVFKNLAKEFEEMK